MKNFEIWGNQIIFQEGYYIYQDANGNNSIISHECARSIEESYYRYMANMDVSRGGLPDDMAYSSRGFKKDGYIYIYDKPFKVDALSEGQNVIRIEGRFELPMVIVGIHINYVHKEAFLGIRKLEEIIIHDDIKEISLCAFKDCYNLKSVVMPNIPLVIGKDAFSGTDILNNVDNSAVYIDNHLIKVSTSICGNYKVRKGTLSISSEAFLDCVELEKIVIPNNVGIIGNRAFSGCQKLNEVVMPNELFTLGTGTFSNCTKLRSCVVPKGVEVIERGVFENCNALDKVTIPDSVKSISFDSFVGTKILHDFMKSDFESLYIENWLILYKPEFEGLLDIPFGTVGIANQPMSYNVKNRAITSVKLPKSMKYIGTGAFENCHNLCDIRLPKGIEVIHRSAFRGCVLLKEIIVPESVKLIDIWVFMDCESLERIIFLSAVTDIIWPTITGRRDKEVIKIIAPNNSPIKDYCKKHGKEYKLEYSMLTWAHKKFVFWQN